MFRGFTSSFAFCAGWRKSFHSKSKRHRIASGAIAAICIANFQSNAVQWQRAYFLFYEVRYSWVNAVYMKEITEFTRYDANTLIEITCDWTLCPCLLSCALELECAFFRVGGGCCCCRLPPLLLLFWYAILCCFLFLLSTKFACWGLTARHRSSQTVFVYKYKMYAQFIIASNAPFL